jgi:hypothetical protein
MSEDRFQIESGFRIPKQPIKPPTAADKVRATLKAMDIGQSFVVNQHERSKARDIAKRLKMEICAERIEAGFYQDGSPKLRYRIWLVDRPENKPAKKLGRPRKVIDNGEPARKESI